MNAVMTNLTDTMRMAMCNGVALPARPRLLVVDDQPLNIQVLYRIFRKDYDVIMTTDGRRVVGMCREKAPDLVLLDVVMPERTGIDVCLDLKNDHQTKEIPVIFVTSQDSADEETRGLEVGAVDFISKPVNPAVVRARVRTHLLLKAQSDALRSLAYMDGLTGLANRRQFDHQLDVEWRAACRNSSNLTIVMIDVDHFKLYNDKYGHQQGDECLKAVAGALRRSMGRPHDFVARYGGEEFAYLFPECDEGGARKIGRSIVSAVSELGLPHAASTAAKTVTISAGFAAGRPCAGSSPMQLLSAADHHLYRAKLKGRNTVEGAAVELTAASPGDEPATRP